MLVPFCKGSNGRNRHFACFWSSLAVWAKNIFWRREMNGLGVPCMCPRDTFPVLENGTRSAFEVRMLPLREGDQKKKKKRKLRLWKWVLSSYPIRWYGLLGAGDRSPLVKGAGRCLPFERESKSDDVECRESSVDLSSPVKGGDGGGEGRGWVCRLICVSIIMPFTITQMS